MIKDFVSIKEFTIPASIKTIIKHHPLSKIFINRGTGQQYFKSVTLYFYLIGEGILLPDYAFDTIVEKTFPKFADKSKHQNNILAMVQNLIELEWNYILESRQLRQLPGSSENMELSKNALSLLKNLKSLLEIKKKFIAGTEIRINPRLTPTKEIEKPKLLSDLQIVINGNLHEKKQIIDLLISNRIQELNSPIFSFLPISFSSGEKLTSRKIKVQINSVMFSQSLEDLAHLFKKRVCNLVWHYMRAEMGWKSKKHTLDEEQGEFIYTILLLFNLMGPEDLNIHDSPRKKSNYIWTFFKTDDEKILPTFPNINIKEYEPEIHVVRRHLRREKTKVGRRK